MTIYTTAGRGRCYDDIVQTVGDTPCVRLNRTGPSHVTLYVKVESFNPLSSVKDRLALNIIEAAERDGLLAPGQTVVEATSGNTGIGLAMVCAAKGYPLVITMAESFSIERRRLMRFLGAKVVLTPKEERGIGMYKTAKKLAEDNGWFFASQFENSANADIHESTTAREILADFAGAPLDYWVTGYGTGGTVTGVARALRRERPDCKIVLSEPHNAALLGSGLAQERHADGSPTGSHPVQFLFRGEDSRPCGKIVVLLSCLNICLLLNLNNKLYYFEIAHSLISLLSCLFCLDDIVKNFCFFYGSIKGKILI